MTAIITRKIKRHPGREDFRHCALCPIGVKSVVLVLTTYEGFSKPTIYGACAHHAELLEPLKKGGEH